MTAAARRRAPPLKVTTTGTPATADLRGLAALLVKLDRQPQLRIVSRTEPAEEPLSHQPQPK